MEALLEFLKQYQIATWIVTVLFVLYLIVNLVADGEVLKNVLYTSIHVGEKIKHLYLVRKKKKYEKILSSEAYLIFQRECLGVIYRPLIEKLQKMGYLIDIVELDWLKDEEKRVPVYEAIAIWNKQIKTYPFGEMFPKERLEIKEPGENKRKAIRTEKYTDNLWNKLNLRERERIRRYRRWMSVAIRHPNRIGYMLDDMDFSENKKVVKCVSTHCEYYLSNILESHILEYELYCFYQRYTHWKVDARKEFMEKLKKNEIDRQKVLAELPIRKVIHEFFKEEEKVLISGKGRHTLLGVQIMILVRNYSGSYDVVTIRRNMDVVVKPGFIQYIPSGGFEAASDKDDIDTQRLNYSIHKILFRELAEECFGMRENIDWEKMSAENIYYQECIQQLLEMIENEDKTGETPSADFEYIGTTMSLVGLRHEFSFLLKIESKDFIKNLIGNYESTNTLNLIDIRNLEKNEYWIDEKEKKYNDIAMLNCTSAGLLMLARKNHLYQDALKGWKS